jgi:hypothetical protein
VSWQNFWRSLSPSKKKLIALAAVALVALVGLGYGLSRARPKLGEYSQVAAKLGELAKDSCDLAAQEKRAALGKIIDSFRFRIHSLWQDRKATEFPEWKMEQVGPVILRLNKERNPKLQGFDASVWSWEGAAGAYIDTQNRPQDPEVKQRWRDLDTMVRYLLENDIRRIVHRRPLLEPELTNHLFRPNASVRRKAKNIFVVRLNPGEFAGAEDKLAAIFRKEWKSHGYEVQVEWAKDDPSAYRMRSHFRSGRSLVNHKEKILQVANFAWTRTLAHELGHILGFDDHYYSVWNGRNCYYTQKSRLTDLMSNSEHGGVGDSHWRLLDLAYPWQKPALTEPFTYKFGS